MSSGLPNNIEGRWYLDGVEVTRTAAQLNTAATTAIVGTTTNDNATAGNIGQVVSSVILAASSITLTTATPANVTSISLTAGDWDVWGNVFNQNTGYGNTDVFYQWISSTSATIPDAAYLSGLLNNLGSNRIFGVPVPGQRFSLSGTTTIYLSVYQNFGAGNGSACGGIYARRAR